VKAATWYKDAVLYQLHIRSFADSNKDGIGDFPGLTEKLDYIVNLGVTAIWLLPFYPSPLRDDGYDIADYRNIHPDYGTITDFKRFLKTAHAKGLKVITELVLNHTSDQHSWFQRSRSAKPGSKWRNYYVWNDNDKKYSEARIIFKDFETSNWSWDSVAQAYYWHRFYRHQPDLNYEEPAVRQEIMRVVDYWFGLGVDGLRMDAVPYLYETEGTDSENQPKTHAFLKELRRHVDTHHPNRMLLAEANGWPEDVVQYFGDDDECHMAFHFPLMPKLYLSVGLENAWPVIDALAKTPVTSEKVQWALFLRNHDELTMEMLTEEERDFFVKIYAQDPRSRINLGIRRRLAPLLNGNRRKIELLHALLLSLPGSPVLYYGDEIGMGDNIYLGDRNGVRTPMQWSADRNAGFSLANPQQLTLPVITEPHYHYESVNVEALEQNPSSFLWWLRRMLALRNRFSAFGRGDISFPASNNDRILAYVRSLDQELILIVANVSRFVQYVTLDLSAWKGLVPRELMGENLFPRIEESPYGLSLGPHSFYWFSLEKKTLRGRLVCEQPDEIPSDQLTHEISSLEDLLSPAVWQKMRLRLPLFLEALPLQPVGCNVRAATIIDGFILPSGSHAVYIVRAETPAVASSRTLIALKLKPGVSDRSSALLARIKLKENLFELIDATFDSEWHQWLHEFAINGKRIRGAEGALLSRRYPSFNKPSGTLQPEVINADHNHLSFLFRPAHALKLFRQLDDGIHPEKELGRFLHERADFNKSPAVEASIEYQIGNGDTCTIAVMNTFLPHRSDGVHLMRESLLPFFESALISSRSPADLDQLLPPSLSPLRLATAPPNDHVRFSIGPMIETAGRIGRLTLELHVALASDSEDPAFIPEPYTLHYQKQLSHGMRHLLDFLITQLTEIKPTVEEKQSKSLDQLIRRKGQMETLFKHLAQKLIYSYRLRTHGDYHLGQLLVGEHGELSIIDFEGRPTRPLTERRIKRSPLRDLASMLWSFYSCVHQLAASHVTNLLPGADRNKLRKIADVWCRWVSAAFLRSYFEAAQELPPTHPAGVHGLHDAALLLDCFCILHGLEKIENELQSREQCEEITLTGLLFWLDSSATSIMRNKS
jgi:maltose alpha-D-glucosyltransferase/alpha-amylase